MSLPGALKRKDPDAKHVVCVIYGLGRLEDPSFYTDPDAAFSVILDPDPESEARNAAFC